MARGWRAAFKGISKGHDMGDIIGNRKKERRYNETDGGEARKMAAEGEGE